MDCVNYPKIHLSHEEQDLKIAGFPLKQGEIRYFLSVSICRIRVILTVKVYSSVSDQHGTPHTLLRMAAYRRKYPASCAGAPAGHELPACKKT